MSSSERVKGLAELQHALDTLPPKLEVNVVRGGMRAGAKVILVAAQASASFTDRSGELRDTLRISTSSRSGVVKASVLAGASKRDRRGWYAPLVERGTAPHDIHAKPGSLLAIGVSHVRHPGASPHPFMVPAFDTHQHAAVAAVASYVRKRLATKHGIDVPAPLERGDE